MTPGEVTSGCYLDVLCTQILLSWDIHISELVKHLNSTTFALRSPSHFTSGRALTKANLGPVVSRLMYGFLILNPLNKRVFISQKRALWIERGPGRW
ncbi:hypothetical protein J6590_041610 [Homalodisca vitripennis]|nr:hypothetical protein J6590_041610 [Homalodisca vitripennis]